MSNFNVHRRVFKGLFRFPELLSEQNKICTEWSTTSIRSKQNKRNPNHKIAKTQPGAVPYYKFTYFPRPGEVDPPYTPVKLHMVKRIKSTYGCPYWEKNVIKRLGLTESRAVAIVKNTPNMNAELYKVKHLVEITPITTPYGLPDDPKNGFLKENGEFISYNCLQNEHTKDLEKVDELMEERKANYMDGPTLKNRLLLNWYSRYGSS